MTNKRIYINGMGVIAPQPTLDKSRFLEEIIPYETNRLKVIDPNYKEFVPADLVRRMSRVIKMGIAASKICLQEAQCDNPDAIITGTGLGCLEDTEKFLSNMIKNKEEFLTPTSFIQSTHNTVGGQIALLLKCHNYNFTYVHRGISLECAMVDAMLKLESGEMNNVLLGSADELTNSSFEIMNRLGYWKRNPVDNLHLLERSDRGTIAGEGASFFFLENQKRDRSAACLEDVITFKTSEEIADLSTRIETFLHKNSLSPAQIDLLVTGRNGDHSNDRIYSKITDHLFGTTPQVAYKHLSGEFHTAIGFGIWAASMVLKNQHIPDVLRINTHSRSEINHVLIYNHFQNQNHSLILLSRA